MAKLSRMPVGIDIIEIYRIERAMSRWRDSFLRRVYTQAELESCHDVAASLAARFAAKEAVMKALGTGTKGLDLWRDIEILSNSDGMPLVQLRGQAQKKAREVGVGEFAVTMSHSKEYAVAFVIGDAV